MHVWAAHLAGAELRVSSPRALEIGALALLCEGAFTSFEGWSLYRGYRFAPWLVLIATAAFLPFEVYEIAQRVRAGRVLVFVVNVAIVVYLARRNWRERRANA
jgi:uncharacterized membrane protein (DUF2068 family)